MKIFTAVLAAIGLAWLGLALAEEQAERGFVDPPIAIAFVALLLLPVGSAIGWSNPYRRVFHRMRRAWTRAVRRHYHG